MEWPIDPISHQQSLDAIKKILYDHEARIATLEKGGKEEKDEMFFIKLEAINGIGRKTAGDIMEVYPNEAVLHMAVTSGEKLPFLDNIERILREYFK